MFLCDECASGYAGFAESVEGCDGGEEEEGGCGEELHFLWG